MPDGNDVARWALLRKVLVLTAVAVVTFVTVLFAGPVSSGAIFMLLPNGQPPIAHDLPEDYEPFHKGAVDLATGLYYRENEDLVVRGTPPLILRRTYLAWYRESVQFGIGATHPGEIWLRGDGVWFQWAELILAKGTRVRFERTSPGWGLINAMYEHRGGVPDYYGARLGWTGANWALQQADGSLSVFQGCGPGGARICSLIQERDSDGHTTYYRRDANGRLMKMESGTRSIAFEYDEKNRITRAHASDGRDVRYAYDVRGRLSTVTASDGVVRRYTYNDRDEIATMEEPGTSITNEYDANGRCIRQVNRYNDGGGPLVFDFAYEVKDGHVVQTESRDSEGVLKRYTWNEQRRALTETRAWEGKEQLVFTYERDPMTQAVTALTLTCPDRTGRPLRHTSIVRPGYEEWIKQNLMQTYCWWRPARLATSRPSPATGDIARTQP